MKSRTLVIALIGIGLAQVGHAQKGTLQSGERPRVSQQRAEPPPRVWQDPYYQNPFTNYPPVPDPVYVYEQRPYGGGHVLLTGEEAQSIIDRFRVVYAGMNNPRLLIHVNRDILVERSGPKLSQREEALNATQTNAGTNANIHMSDPKAAPTLADPQTARDVERLFGRPLRLAGASFADQRVATQALADRSMTAAIGSTGNPQAQRDREALAEVADIAIEVLISSRAVTVPGITQDATVHVPDIQATAIRLKDARILGQASTSEVTDRVPPAALAGFDVRQITEATALALMDDMASTD